MNSNAKGAWHGAVLADRYNTRTDNAAASSWPTTGRSAVAGPVSRIQDDGIAWYCLLSSLHCSVVLLRPDELVPVSLQNEEPAQKMGVLDAEGKKQRFHVKSTHTVEASGNDEENAEGKVPYLGQIR